MVNREKDLDLKPVHPGEILREELLIPLKLSAEQLAKNTQIEEETIKKLLAEKQDITPDTSYRLGLFFDLRDDYWLSLQKRYELDCWKDREGEEKEEELEQQQPTIKRLRLEKEALQTELNQAKQERQEIKTKYEVLTQKSWFYQACDKAGLVSLKNSIANISTIGGMVVFLFIISWMWKNMIIPTFRNFKGEPKPNNPNPQPQLAPTQPIYPHQPAREARIETVKQLPEEVMDVKTSPAESSETKKPVETNVNLREENSSKEIEQETVKKVKKKGGRKKTERKKKLKDS